MRGKRFIFEDTGYCDSYNVQDNYVNVREVSEKESKFDYLYP